MKAQAIAVLLCSASGFVLGLETKAQNALPVPEVRLSGNDLYNSITRDVENTLRREFEESANTRLAVGGAFVTAIVGGFGFLGIRRLEDFERNLANNVTQKTVQAISQDLRIEAEAIAENVMKGRLDTSFSQLSTDLSLFRFRSLASEIDQADKVDNELKDAALDIMKKLAQNESIFHSGEFSTSIDKLVASFASANMLPDLESLFEEYPVIMNKVTSKHSLFYMTRLYAQEVLGQKHATDTASRKSLENFRRYSDKLIEARYPEMAYIYLMPFYCSQTDHGNYQERIDRMKDDVRSFTKEERQTFVNALTSECEHDYSEHPAYFQRFQHILLQFANDNNTWIKELAISVSEQTTK
jgi:hypothetical protein